MPKTKKPCPLCKEKVQRDADALCFICTREVKRLRDLEERSKNHTLKLFNVPVSRSYHAWCNWAGRYLVGGSYREREQGLGGIIAKLIIALAPPADSSLTKVGQPETFLPDRRYEYGYHFAPVYMSEEAADLVVKFKKELDAEISRAYEAGVDYGRNLLAGLATGEVSASDFDAGRTEPRRR